MIVLAFDPGEKTGWCVYDTERRIVTHAGQFPGFEVDVPGEVGGCDVVVIERPKGQGPTFPQVVEAGIVFGWLLRWAQQKWQQVEWLYRYDVKRTLTEATLREITVVNDKTAWQAIKLLHGGAGCDKKPTKANPEGGPLGRVKSHERAALAAAVAWALRSRQILA